MHGYDFFESGQKADTLISMPRFSARFEWLSNLGDVFVTIQKGFIVIFVAVVFDFIFALSQTFQTSLNNANVPLFIIIMICIFISSIFSALYGTTIDAILVCYFLVEASDDQNGEHIALEKCPSDALIQVMLNFN